MRTTFAIVLILTKVHLAPEELSNSEPEPSCLLFPLHHKQLLKTSRYSPCFRILTPLSCFLVEKAAHLLLVQLHKQLRDPGITAGQLQTLDAEFRKHKFQNVFQRKTTTHPMFGHGWDRVLQDGSSESGQLRRGHKACEMVVQQGED